MLTSILLLLLLLRTPVYKPPLPEKSSSSDRGNLLGHWNSYCLEANIINGLSIYFSLQRPPLQSLSVTHLRPLSTSKVSPAHTRIFREMQLTAGTLTRNVFPSATRLSSAIRLTRSFAAVAPGAPPPQATTPYEVFDRQAKRRQRDRAATREGGEKSRLTDYLRAEVADRMFERFEVG